MTGDDLTTWLRAQLDRVEQETRKLLVAAQQTSLRLQEPRLLGREIPGWHDWPDVERLCAERLAEVDAKRRILDMWTEWHATAENGTYHAGRRDQLAEVIETLALPYADREGYREEWRP
jgi:hypothetical protein